MMPYKAKIKENGVECAVLGIYPDQELAILEANLKERGLFNFYELEFIYEAPCKTCKHGMVNAGYAEKRISLQGQVTMY